MTRELIPMPIKYSYKDMKGKWVYTTKIPTEGEFLPGTLVMFWDHGNGGVTSMQLG